MKYIKLDKKKEGKKINYILLKDVGNPCIEIDVDDIYIENALNKINKKLPELVKWISLCQLDLLEGRFNGNLRGALFVPLDGLWRIQLVHLAEINKNVGIWKNLSDHG